MKKDNMVLRKRKGSWCWRIEGSELQAKVSGQTLQLSVASVLLSAALAFEHVVDKNPLPHDTGSLLIHLPAKREDEHLGGLHTEPTHRTQKNCTDFLPAIR